MRSSEIFLRNVHWISNVMLSIIPSYTSAVLISKNDKTNDNDDEKDDEDDDDIDDEYEDDEDDIAAFLDEEEDDIDDLDIDEEDIPLGKGGGGKNDTKQSKKNTNGLDPHDPRASLHELKLDNWINFYLSTTDYDAVLHIRNYITALIDLYVQHSYHIHIQSTANTNNDGTASTNAAATSSNSTHLATTVVPRILAVISQILESEKIVERNDDGNDTAISASPSPSPSPSPYPSSGYAPSPTPQTFHAAGYTPRGRGGGRGRGRGHGNAQGHHQYQGHHQNEQRSYHRNDHHGNGGGASSQHATASPLQFIPPQVRQAWQNNHAGSSSENGNTRGGRGNGRGHAHNRGNANNGGRGNHGNRGGAYVPRGGGRGGHANATANAHTQQQA